MDESQLRQALQYLQCFNCGHETLKREWNRDMRNLFLENAERADSGKLHGVTVRTLLAGWRMPYVRAIETDVN